MRFLNNAIAPVKAAPFWRGSGWVRRLGGALADAFEGQSKLYLFWAPVSLACGIGLYFSLPFEPALWQVLSLFGGLAGLCTALFWRGFYRSGLLFLFVLTLPALGCLVAVEGSKIHGTPMISRSLGPVSLEGTIETIELLDQQNDVRILFSDLLIEDLKPEHTPKKVRLRFRKAPDTLVAGQRLKVLVELMPNSEALIPGGFNFRRHFFFQGIGAVGFVYRLDGDVPDVQDAPVHALENLRSAIARRIHASLPEAQANIAEALIIGRRAGIDDRVYDDLRASGLAHLLAISGLHIGLVAGALFFFVRMGLASSERLTLYHPIKKYAAVVAIIGAFIYMVLSGAPVPTQRAMIMTAIVFGAILLDRWPFSLRAVAVAAFIVLMIAPHVLLSVSFQLSFAAVTALVACSELFLAQWQGLKSQPGMLRRVALYFGGVALTSLLAALATAPFALYHFQQVAMLGVLANMIAIPVMAFWVMPFGIIAMLLMPLGLEEIPLWIMGQGLDQITLSAHFVAELKGSVWHIPQYDFISFVAMVCAGLSLIIFTGRVRQVLLCAFSILAVLTFQYRSFDMVVAQDFEQMGIVESGRLVLAKPKGEKFTTEIWTRALDVEASSGRSLYSLPGMYCDSDGCRYEREGLRIAFPSSDYAFAQDCGWADIMIASFYPEGKCKSAKVIDKRSMRRSGSIGIHFKGEGGFEIEASRSPHKRPWSE